jgi:hypothetical protein
MISHLQTVEQLKIWTKNWRNSIIRIFKAIFNGKIVSKIMSILEYFILNLEQNSFIHIKLWIIWHRLLWFRINSIISRMGFWKNQEPKHKYQIKSIIININKRANLIFQDLFIKKLSWIVQLNVLKPYYKISAKKKVIIGKTYNKK